jgi:hypothetical protein
MNWLRELMEYLSHVFKWWVIVLPWQQGIRIRLGKHETLLNKGMYLRIPVIDTVFIQNKRIKYIQIPTQTLTTKDEKTITISGAIAFEVMDIRKLYNTISNPDSTLTGIAMSKIAEWISTNFTVNCTPDKLHSNVQIDGDAYGLQATIKITGFAIVKTFRIIQDGSWLPTDKIYEI